MLQFLAQCASCGSTASLGPDVVTKTQVALANGKSPKAVWLTHFDCPKCGHTHFVQIDDARTQMLLSDMVKVIGSALDAKRDGHSVKKQSAKYYRINRDLSAIRSDLEKEYTGVNVSLPGRRALYTLEFVKLSTPGAANNDVE